MTLNNFAVFFKSQGKYDQAQAMCRRALSIFRKALGSKHPKVITCRLNYASLLRAMKRPAEAKNHVRCMRALSRSMRAGGSELRRALEKSRRYFSRI
jgi:hypothetical protein